MCEVATKLFEEFKNAKVEMRMSYSYGSSQTTNNSAGNLEQETRKSPRQPASKTNRLKWFDTLACLQDLWSVGA